ncbi:TPA: hypothetical protein VDB83_001186 [Burkholderia cenocepacia]|uniref:hypothetical protein n=1 Tax=Burkholderia cenocepacia TaxID=95486 RepID=UPI001B8FCB31|nr:hypothetical protein [Burkholderia cenocepacia]MBR8096346.1 hypothetical protein [Burkholderia cenocepacia]HEP6426915.1 hypothetical protein [Burkholderia cenocepacia]
MNVRPGDLAYIVVPKEFNPLLDGKFVYVRANGECDIGTMPAPGIQCWICEFHVPWFCDRVKKMVQQCWLRDDWLRPIRGVPVTDDVEDEVTA